MQTREVRLWLDYLSIEAHIDLIDDPNGSICRQILTHNRPLFERVQGSTHNHQVWEGGYIDHVTDVMNRARHSYTLEVAYGRPMPFSLSDVLLILFLHDLEKPWRIVVDGRGNVSNRPGLSTKEEFQIFREDKLDEYGIDLTPYQVNALMYVEGELKDYSSTRRVMNELAAFCHMEDTWSARGRPHYPKLAGEDEWIGAGRFRTTV